MDYQVLDEDVQKTAVEARIRDLERQHLEVSLRVEAPSVGEGQNEYDKNNLARLDESLNVLYAKRDAFNGQAKPAAPAAPAA